MRTVVDQREVVAKLFDVLGGVRNVTFALALVQAIAALLLISNTVQVSAFTRRTEVGIMRLVGATRWYTQLPFLIEAVVTGVVGAVLAVGRSARRASSFHRRAAVRHRSQRRGAPDRARRHPAGSRRSS